MNYLKDDTIAALSTAAGQSAIAVIRLSGRHSPDIIERVFKPSSKTDKQVRRGFIMDGNIKKDEVLCTFFKEPDTYTGENLIEISCHGNPVIIKEILELLYKNGARPAQAGEFTYRAFLNGKMDLAEAEAVCSLIKSKTDLAAKAALNSISGEFSNKIKGVLDPLVNLLAHIEASLDYPSDDIPFLTPQQKTERLEMLINETKKISEAYKMSRRLWQGLKAAIIGKPNAGKSSLLNSILGKNRAIVTEIPGTTTDTLEETIDCKGIPLTIIDTAGIRKHAENSIEILGQERAKDAAFKADLIVWVFDASVPLDANDKEIADYLADSGLKDTYIIGVLNKSDLPMRLNADDIKNHSNFNAILKLSSKSGKGVPELLDAIATFTGITDTQTELLSINSRHFTLLQGAIGAFFKAQKAAGDEIAIAELKNALAAFEEILGINTPTDILDAIFSNFCIGK